MQRHHAHQPFAVLYALADLHLTASNNAIHRRFNDSTRQIHLRLFNLRLCQHHFRVGFDGSIDGQRGIGFFRPDGGQAVSCGLRRSRFGDIEVGLSLRHRVTRVGQLLAGNRPGFCQCLTPF